jgi:hypothetical protein
MAGWVPVYMSMVRATPRNPQQSSPKFVAVAYTCALSHAPRTTHGRGPTGNYWARESPNRCQLAASGLTALSCGGPRAVTEDDIGASWMIVCIVYPASACITRGARAWVHLGAGEPSRPPQDEGQGKCGAGDEGLE